MISTGQILNRYFRGRQELSRYDKHATTKMSSRHNSRSLFAKLAVLMLCILGVDAISEHGHTHHPRFRGGGGGRGGAPDVGRGRGGGPGSRFGGAYRQTWFGQLQTRFDDVPIVDDRGIQTSEFLDAAQSLPAFFGLLGQVGFYPARADSEANIQKIRNRYNAAQSDSSTLQSLVRKEKNDRVAYSGSAAEALLWLTRTLDFTAQSLRKDLNDNKNISPDDPNPRKPLSEAFQRTYPGALQRFHDSWQRTAFSAAWSMVPRRRDFYWRLAADDSSQAAVQDTERWVMALEDIIRILNQFTESPDSRW